METTRRSFLAGLIAAPAIVRYDSLMPVRLFTRPGQSIQLGEIWPVVDTKSGLVLRLSARQIIDGGSRYLPYFESVPDPSADKHAKRLLHSLVTSYGLSNNHLLLRKKQSRSILDV